MTRSMSRPHLRLRLRWHSHWRSCLLMPLVLLYSALAQAAPADLLYQGADRQARLVEAAKKEGEVSVYHVYPALVGVMQAFTQKYGIKVKPWRAGSEAVLQRVVAESQANRFEVDLVQNNAPENEATHREKLLQPVWSPYQADLLPPAVAPHKEWAGITFDVWTGAYNTQQVKASELPKTYRDLLDPKWKGRLGIEAGDFAWWATLLEAMPDKQGAALFAQIVATNGISVRKGHSLVASLVASGEVPLALTVYSWNPEQLKRKGAPIEALVLQPLIAQPSTIAVMKHAPHPNAALLLYDFLLNEGQTMLAAESFVVTSSKVESPYHHVPLIFVDPNKAIDQQDKWFKAFDDQIVRKAK